MTSSRRAHGPTVRAIRAARGLTIYAVSDLADITPGYLSKIENGVRRAEADVTTRLATALDVPAAILTGQRPAITVIRDALALDRAAMARDVGLTPGQLERIERGVEAPDPAQLHRIAVRLGVDVDALAASALTTAAS